MKLTGVPRLDGLALSILVAALVGCGSPTRPDPDGAVVTGSPPAQSSASSAPRFAADGPNAEEYGAREGYPIRAIHRVPFFVGAFSHYDQIFEGRMVRRAAMPSRLTRASAEPALRYEYQAETRTLDNYLARNSTTGLLIARGDTILVERYQYARNDRHRFTSSSMAKTVTAMLMGTRPQETVMPAALRRLPLDALKAAARSPVSVATSRGDSGGLCGILAPRSWEQWSANAQKSRDLEW